MLKIWDKYMVRNQIVEAKSVYKVSTSGRFGGFFRLRHINRQELKWSFSDYKKNRCKLSITS